MPRWIPNCAHSRLGTPGSPLMAGGFPSWIMMNSPICLIVCISIIYIINPYWRNIHIISLIALWLLFSNMFNSTYNTYRITYDVDKTQMGGLWHVLKFYPQKNPYSSHQLITTPSFPERHSTARGVAETVAETVPVAPKSAASGDAVAVSCAAQPSAAWSMACRRSCGWLGIQAFFSAFHGCKMEKPYEKPWKTYLDTIRLV
jgi:hypothetical protein